VKLIKTVRSFLISRGILKHMRIENEAMGIAIDATVRGNNLVYRVVEQSPEASAAIKHLDKIIDEDTNMGLTINNFPNFKHTNKTFFLRGKDETRNNDEVTAKFASPAEAQGALFALDRLVQKIVTPAEMKPTPGATTHVRMAIITKDQARKLCVSANKFYPERREWPNEPVEPVVTENTHYNEHIGQAVDILNKTKTNDPIEYNNRVVNPHKVASEDARYAVEAVRRLFDNAEARGDGALVAVWRLVTGLRAPDVKNSENKNDGGPENPTPAGHPIRNARR
jgi:hypothetical protein